MSDIRQRRAAAVRQAGRILARDGFHHTIRERLALLQDAAPEVYDLDEPVDFYGNRVVVTLEERRRAAGHRGRRVLPDRHDGAAGGPALLGGPHRRPHRRPARAGAPRDA